MLRPRVFPLVVALAAALSGVGCECGGAGTVSDLEWLVGRWHTEGVGGRPVVEEIWRRADGGHLLGVSHPMLGDTPMVTQEQKLVVEQRDGVGVVYEITPPTQPATTFALRSVSSGRYVFRRLDDDAGWPAQVVYERVGSDRIRVLVSGPAGEGEPERTETWELHRSEEGTEPGPHEAS